MHGFVFGVVAVGVGIGISIGIGVREFRNRNCFVLCLFNRFIS
jgi:hypothetical protein